MGVPISGSTARRTAPLRLAELPPIHAVEQSPSERLIDSVIRVGIVIALIGVAIQAVAGMTNIVLFHDEYTNLNPDREGNPFSWASAVATFAGGFVAILIGLARSDRRRLLVLGAILAFFSLDDTVRIHETWTLNVNEKVVGIEPRMLWPMLWLPLLATAFLVLWTTAREVVKRGGFLIRLGLVLLVAAVCLEVSAMKYGPEDDDLASAPYMLEVVTEEGAELAGWTFIALGLTALLVTTLSTPTRRTTDRPV